MEEPNAFEDTPAAAAAPVEASLSEAPWLDAWNDPVADVRAHGPHLCLADLDGSGEGRLVAADLRQSLKVFSNTTMVSVQRLLDEPVAVTAYHSKQDGAVALVAVATGSALYVYRSMRAYFKFALPQPPVDVQEATVWQQLRSGLLTTAAAVEALVDLRDRGVRLTTLTRTLLALDGADTMAEFVQSNAATKLEHHDSIVCMTVLQKATADPGSPSCLVLGTECGIVYVLSPDLSSTDANVLARVELPSTPTHLTVAGVRDVLYRITVACRDGNVYSIKNGERTGVAMNLETLCCGLARLGKNVLVACLDRSVHNFHVKGKKNYTLQMPDTITNLVSLPIHLNASAAVWMVALASGEVRMYNERSLLHTISLGEPVTAIKFGLFSRESNSLVMVTRRGSLHVRILKRRATLTATKGGSGPPPEQDMPLPVPKKTRLYVEQSQRERESAVEMHRLFQRDLCKLRLHTARAFVGVISEGRGPQSYNARAMLRLTAQLRGIGPEFRIVVNVQNVGRHTVMDAMATLAFDHGVYACGQPLARLPALLPGLTRTVHFPLHCVDPNGAAADVRIVVHEGAHTCVPLLTAIVTMPLSEPGLE